MDFKKLVRGNKYSFTTEEVIEGVFVNETKDFIYLKESSGYNVGVSKSKVKNFELLEEKKTVKEKKSKANKGEIVILHTGGTIASKVDYSTGAVNSSFTPEEILELFPELRKIGSVESHLISNMPSDDMNFSHYNVIGKKIDELIKRKDVKGIILTHGTDTLHYTSAALSFMLRNVTKPVVVVGSQRSSDRPSSDAAVNLLNSAYFVKNTDNKGVFVCMHENTSDDFCLIHKATNVRKNHTSRRDAFDSVNAKPVGRVNFEKKKFEEEKVETKGEYEFKIFNEKLRVGLLKARPGLTSEELEVYKKFDGLVLEGTGLGHFPIGFNDKYTKDNEKILKTIKEIASKKVVTMTSQCINGRINMNVYTPGRILKEANVLGHNLDMQPETAYIKLAFLLSNYKKDEAKDLYSTNLVGEINERSEE